VDAVDFLRERSDHIPSESTAKRVYISRRYASFRRIINEIQLEPILKKFGFKIIYNEDLNLKNQISIFKSAEFVCGAHGAGLANIAFCHKGASALEIIMEERFPLGGLFWELACAAELDYHVLRAKRVPIIESHLVDGDMYVDPKQFEAALDYMITQKI
jgi:capsular polysaccharide biosynthesis protein